MQDDTKAANLLGKKIAMLLLCICISELCVTAKNTAQSQLRDVGQCCKEVPLPSKSAVDAWDML